MNERIWKYSLVVEDTQNVDMPEGSVPISVGVQHGTPVIWVRVPLTIEKLETYFIRTAGTGHTYNNDSLEFIGTYMLLDGDFVGHVFWSK